MSLLDMSYKIDKSGPRKLDWDVYELKALKKYKDLLDTENLDEDKMQEFFEKNPCFIPGAFGELTNTTHKPLHGSLISQPILPGFKSKIPDFMWIAKNSDYMIPVLIEIEKPNKEYFNKNLTTTAMFNQAHGQLAEWKAWFDNPENHQIFAKTYNFYDDPTFNGRAIKPIYLLIYGRNSEINTREKRDKKGALSRIKEHIMTYDRLAPSSNMKNLLCVKKKTSGYELLTFPPYTALSPNMANDLLKFQKSRKSVVNNELMTENRANFVYSRFSYWDAWASNDKLSKAMILGDEE